ncbi:MAG: Uma2 family endonuclease [Symploca sp. SIO3E6]|nr:Uma2 family endonuclease [Caldora sp. SIO3E6]
MAIAANRRMTLEEYLNYDDGTDTHYELVNGVLVEMGAESTINTQIAVFLLLCFAQLNIPAYRLGIKQKIAVKSTVINAREPDLMIHSEASAMAIDDAPQAIVKLGHPTPMLIVEVVSPGKPGEDNYDRDYIEKRWEYAARGIAEYWLIDPHRQVVLVMTLQGQSYQEQRFTGTNAIASPTFPNLNLTAAQILNAGKG